MTINKDRWRSGHAGLLGIRDILVKFLSDLGRGHIAFELVYLQAKFDGDIVNGSVVKGREGKKGVMEFPKFTLFAGGKRGTGGGVGKLMHCQRQILHDNLDGIGIFFEHLLEERRNLAAVGSLEIGEKGYGNRCLGQTEKGRTGGIDVNDKVDAQIGEGLGLLVDKEELFSPRGDINGRYPFIHGD